MLGPKLILAFGVIVISIMCLYPPYRSVGISPLGEIPLQEGYYSILSPPQNQIFNTGRSAYSIIYSIDSYRLFGQIIFAGVASISVATVLYSIRRK